MSSEKEITAAEIENLVAVLKKEAASGGYNLNPDAEVTWELAKGLLVNEKRYGYRSCPCRLATGEKEKDLDIICPCDYRDPDLNEYNTCYCGLYVSREVVEGRVKISSIPERRPPRGERNKPETKQPGTSSGTLPLPVWRCRVCGYLCARDEPPEVCPICRAKQERFERFI